MLNISLMMRNIYFELSKRKKLKIIPLIGMLVFPYFLHIPKCVALSDSEIALSLHWPEATFYQGDIQNVTVTLSGTSNNVINITWIGIHFAWIDPGERGRMQKELAGMAERIHTIGPARRLVTRASAPGAAP